MDRTLCMRNANEISFTLLPGSKTSNENIVKKQMNKIDNNLGVQYNIFEVFILVYYFHSHVIFTHEGACKNKRKIFIFVTIVSKAILDIILLIDRNLKLLLSAPTVIRSTLHLQHDL